MSGNTVEHKCEEEENKCHRTCMLMGSSFAHFAFSADLADLCFVSLSPLFYELCFCLWCTGVALCCLSSF